ncbi:MAG: DUF4190 domain-containing protein [Lentisphaerae bacterium]|nr:DUF4190 domain-containing protein [Lentisphaerota bacterium]
MKTDVASMVLGILAIVLAIVPALGIVLGVLALVIGRGIHSGYRTAGVVCGAVGLPLAAVATIFVLGPVLAPWIYTVF